MRTFTGRSAPSLLDKFLARRRAPAGEGLPSSDGDHRSARVALAELMAAATVLDFGGWPIELPGLRDVWRSSIR